MLEGIFFYSCIWYDLPLKYGDDQDVVGQGDDHEVVGQGEGDDHDVAGQWAVCAMENSARNSTRFSPS